MQVRGRGGRPGQKPTSVISVAPFFFLKLMQGSLRIIKLVLFQRTYFMDGILAKNGTTKILPSHSCLS